MHAHGYVKSMFSSCFWNNWFLKASNRNFEMVLIHICLHILHIYGNWFELDLFETPLGVDFTN